MKDRPAGASLWLTSAISTFLSHVLIVFSKSPFRTFSLTYSITGGTRNSLSRLRSFLFKASSLARSWVGKDPLNPGIPGASGLLDLLALPSLPIFSVVLKTMFTFSKEWRETQNTDFFKKQIVMFSSSSETLTNYSLEVSFPPSLLPSLPSKLCFIYVDFLGLAFSCFGYNYVFKYILIWSVSIHFPVSICFCNKSTWKKVAQVKVIMG